MVQLRALNLGACHVSDCNCDGRLDFIGFEANVSHVALDELDLVLQVSCSHFTFADAVAQDLVNLFHDRLSAVPEHFSLLDLLLHLFLCFYAAIPSLFNLFPALLPPLVKAIQACFQFLLHDHFSVFY